MTSTLKLTALLWIAAAPALAQTTGTAPTGSPPMGTSSTTQPDMAPSMPTQPGTTPGQPGAMADQGADAGTGQMTPPSSWHGTSQQWSAHMKKCQSRTGYDPSTDQYQAANGKTRTCPR